MPQLDLKNGFLNVENKLKAFVAFKDLSTQYKNVKKQAGKTFEKRKGDVSRSLDSAKKKTNNSKSYQQKAKTQFEQLLDLSKLTSNTNSTRYIKLKLLDTIRVIEPQITTILLDDTLKAVGCDQNQKYVGGQKVYIKVQSIDYNQRMIIKRNIMMIIKVRLVKVYLILNITIITRQLTRVGVGMK